MRQRENKKEERARAEKERTRRLYTVILSFIAIIALVFAGVAYQQKEQADEKKEEALARSLASQSEQMRGVTGSLTESALLAVESLRHKETLEGNVALRRSIDLLPRFMTKLQHDTSVYVVAFSPDGQKLVTASDDRSARLWYVETGKQLQRLEHDTSVYVVAFSPDGQKLATASADGTAQIWTLDIKEVMGDACRRVAENMTRKEWTRFLEDQDSDCITCPANGTFDRNSIWPWGRRECQPCGGSLG